MIVTVTRTANAADTVTLRDAENFRQFHIAAPEATDAELTATLLANGVIAASPTSDEYEVLVSWLRANAGEVATTDAWQESFQNMLDYAQSKGWYSVEAGSIRAHVER